MPTNEPSPELLTYTEAAQYIHLSVRQLERAVARKALAHYRVNGRNIRFTKSQLDAYLADALVLPVGVS
ncbi:helix-turn-helix domain-containing protein [Microbacterium lacus]|uniref:Helix-turn-helix domain-containing protein n=1 Tax=Microbacterium lacus TaxID=415217 RepID=A0ABP4S204_9MICO